ncbi:MAG: ribosome maturation factor RimP [Bacilli bacterium]|nr:ribosome maturation factor RimP [Bacilli bacterium]
MNTLESKIHSLLNEKLNHLGYQLINVHYLRESGENYLRIIVDKDGDISLDEIVKLSDLISPLLDASDVINDRYILDISSLGAEKEINLARLDKYLNKYLNVHLSHPYQGLNNIEGTLLKVDRNNVTMLYQIKARKKEITLERKYIDKAHLAIKF